MKAGFSERDITPEPGMEQPGGYGKAFNAGWVHDPCKVRAAVFDDDGTRVALVGVDVAMMPRCVVLSARDEICRQCGIPREFVLIAASHTHSGGPMGMVRRGEFDHASALVQRLAYKQSTCDDPGYVETVQRAIVDAVVEADARRAEVLLGIGAGCEDQVAFNRRLRMKNGRTYTHPGKGHPDILGFAGPIDPEVGVIGVWDHKNGLLGCVVNYACHGTTGPGGISADWIYFMERTIRGVWGDHVIVVFLNGACGDVTQVNNLVRDWDDSGERSARFVGTRVGAEVVKVLATLPVGEVARVSSRSELLMLSRRRPSAGRLQRSLDTLEQAEPGSTEWLFAKESLMLDALLQSSPLVEVEIQAIQVGPAVLIANPAELFCQLGLEIKAASAFPYTYVVELANGKVGYVPTEDAFGPNGGGYETRLTSYSNLPVGAGASIVDTSVSLIQSLAPGAVPIPPQAKAWVGEWNYGNVPAELE